MKFLKDIKTELARFTKLKYIREIMKINIMFFLFFMISDSMDVFIPLYIKGNQLPAVLYGALQTVTTILRMILIWLMAKPKMETKRRIVIIFFAINVLDFGLLKLGNTYIALYIFAMIILTRTLFNTIMNPYLARLLPNEYMGIGFGVRDVFLSLGCAVGLIVSGFLTKNPTGFIVYIIILLFILFVMLWTNSMLEIDEINTDDDEEDNENLKSWKDASARLKWNFVLIVLIGCLLCCGLEVHDYSAMLGDDIGVTVQNIYNLYSSSVIITAIFSIVGGIIIDRVNAKAMYIFYLLICFCSCFVLVFGNVYAYALSLVLLGFKGVFDNVEQTYFFKLYKEYDMERLYSANAIIQMVLSFAAPVVFGWLYDVSYTLMVTVGVGFMIAALLCSFGISGEKRVQEK